VCVAWFVGSQGHALSQATVLGSLCSSYIVRVRCACRLHWLTQCLRCLLLPNSCACIAWWLGVGDGSIPLSGSVLQAFLWVHGGMTEGLND
jgi:hypothetical protein